MPASLKVTLHKSPIGYTAATRGTVRALGLRRVGQTVDVVDNVATRGMLRAVRFLVTVDEASRDGASEGSK
jgi:large subunit ribosomal protein L30